MSEEKEWIEVEVSWWRSYCLMMKIINDLNEAVNLGEEE